LFLHISSLESLERKRKYDIKDVSSHLFQMPNFKNCTYLFSSEKIIAIQRKHLYPKVLIG
ncbi:MAG TPA: hypothetical protein VES38_03240, partial [Methylotenera sp.]|nr:hypothetical protein [Methylotenera sp.]